MKRSLIFPLLLLLLPFTMRAQEEAPAIAAADSTATITSDTADTTASGNKVTIEVAPPGSADSMIVVTGKDGERILSLGKGKGNNYSLKIAGVEFGLGPKQSPWADFANSMADIFSGKDESKNCNCYSGHLGILEFGFNGLTPPDYNAYADDEKGFLDLRMGKSTYVGLFLPGFSHSLSHDKRFGFSTGLGMVWRNYTFNNDITLVRQSCIVRPVPVPSGTRKSKLSTFSFVVPLLAEYSFSDNLFLSVGPYGELLLSSHTKYKFSGTSVRSRGSHFLNTFQGGITGRVGIGWGGLYLFGNYALTGLFKRDKGPGTAVYTFGLGIGA